MSFQKKISVNPKSASHLERLELLTSHFELSGGVLNLGGIIPHWHSKRPMDRVKPPGYLYHQCMASCANNALHSRCIMVTSFSSISDRHLHPGWQTMPFCKGAEKALTWEKGGGHMMPWRTLHMEKLESGCAHILDLQCIGRTRKGYICEAEEDIGEKENCWR